MRVGNKKQRVCLGVHACVSVCASEHVCIVFMARNQLSLAHNGNVKSPERFPPTQEEIWLGAGCIFANLNSERELARLKFYSPPPPLLSLLPGAVHSFAHILLKQVIQTGLTETLKNIFTHICAHVLSIHTLTHLQVQPKGEATHIMTDDIFHGCCNTTAPKCYT